MIKATWVVEKLGDLVSVTAGPGAAAFGGVVILSLVAGATFDPHRLWDAQEATG